MRAASRSRTASSRDRPCRGTDWRHRRARRRMGRRRAVALLKKVRPLRLALRGGTRLQLSRVFRGRRDEVHRAHTSHIIPLIQPHGARSKSEEPFRFSREKAPSADYPTVQQPCNWHDDRAISAASCAGRTPLRKAKYPQESTFSSAATVRPLAAWPISWAPTRSYQGDYGRHAGASTARHGRGVGRGSAWSASARPTRC